MKPARSPDLARVYWIGSSEIDVNEPCEDVLRGHADQVEALEALRASYVIEEGEAPLLDLIHGYARWTLAGLVSSKRGPGAFPVTWVTYTRERK